MKKAILLSAMIMAILVFSYGSFSKKASETIPSLVSYDENLAPVVMANCAPCHFHNKGGKKKRLDSYKSVSSQIDEVLRRIQLNPKDRGFMPNKNPKLADSTIAIFKKWKEDGLLK